MKTALKPTKTPKITRRRPLNLRVDGALADEFSEYCRRNQKAGSVSYEVEMFMLRTIAQRGHRYGLRIPSHFVNGK